MESIRYRLEFFGTQPDGKPELSARWIYHLFVHDDPDLRRYEISVWSDGKTKSKKSFGDGTFTFKGTKLAMEDFVVTVIGKTHRDCPLSKLTNVSVTR